MKLQKGPVQVAYNFAQKQTLTQVFSWEFWEILKNASL